MFMKTTATKFAHSSILPLGNRDLRSLQELINAEKSVVTSLQRLSVDLTKSSDVLKVWGSGEGDDLGDVLTHSTSILSHISNALSVFASHEQTVREHMKAIRTREEKLDETRSRRKVVGVKADAAEKKLSKMGSENKNLPGQTDILNAHRDEIRQLDSEIMTEEARIGDFKRKTVKSFMILKLGGLAEFAEKATIVGELGKLLLDEIPLEPTIPGQGRAIYAGRERTEKLEQEVARCVGDVVFAGGNITEDNLPSNTLRSGDIGEMSPIPGRPSSELPYTLPVISQEGYEGGRVEFAAHSPISTPQKSSPLPEFGERSPLNRSGMGSMKIGDDGSRIVTPTTSSPSTSGVTGGKFSTFPVRSARSGSRSQITEHTPSDIEARGSTYSPYGNLDLESYAHNDLSVYSTAPASAPNPWVGPSVATESFPLPEKEDDSHGSPHKAVRFMAQPQEIGESEHRPQPELRTNGGDEVHPRSPPLYTINHPVISTPYAETVFEEEGNAEEALNLAAAREVSRELDALHFNPTPSIDRTPSPLLPPTRPFANRPVSPGPPLATMGVREPPSPSSRVSAPVYPSPERQSNHSFPNIPPSPQANPGGQISGDYSASPTGGRTISAAAFKRNPARTDTGDGGTSPLQLKKRALPASPYPPHRQPSNASMHKPPAGAAPPNNFAPKYFDSSPAPQIMEPTSRPENRSQMPLSTPSPVSPQGQALGSPNELPPTYQFEDGQGSSHLPTSPLTLSADYGRLGQVTIMNPDENQHESESRPEWQP